MMCGGVVRIELDGTPEFLLTSSQIPVIQKMNHGGGGVRSRQRAVDLQRLEGSGLRLRHGLTRRQPADDGRSAQRQVGIRKTAVGGRIAGIGGDGLLEISERLLESRLGPPVPEEASPQVVLVGL